MTRALLITNGTACTLIVIEFVTLTGAKFDNRSLGAGTEASVTFETIAA
jgi:hypothetical protein